MPRSEHYIVVERESLMHLSCYRIDWQGSKWWWWGSFQNLFWSHFQFDHIFNVILITFSMSIWSYFQCPSRQKTGEQNTCLKKTTLWKNRCKPNIYSYYEKIHCTGKYWKDIWKRRCGDSPLDHWRGNLFDNSSSSSLVTRSLGNGRRF